MVKPPRTMEPEMVDLKKAGRTAAKAFEEDSFRNYMARKIDMQRKQWGAGELPPDPRKLQQHNKHEGKCGNLPTTPLATHENGLGGDLKGNKSSSTSGSQKRKLHHVSFAPGVKDNQDNSGSMKQIRSKRSKGPMNSIVKKLERRHGRGFRRRRSSHLAASNQTEEHHLDDLTIDHTMADNPAQPSSQSDQATAKHRTFDSQHIAASGSRQSEQVTAMDCHEKHDDITDANSDKLPCEGQADEYENSSVVAAASGGLTVGLLEEGDDSDSEDNKADNQQLDGSTLTRSPKLLQARPDLFFFGVVIMVNGYTTPDTESLQRMVQQHGGFLEKYETSKITHIIAEHLSTAKAKIYKKMKKPIPVVKPSWIVDCVAAFRLLPHGDYLLDEVRDNNSGTMRTFLKKPDAAMQAHSMCAGVMSKPTPRQQETNSDNPAPHERLSLGVEQGHSASKAPKALMQQAIDQETEVSSITSAKTAGIGRTDDKYINGLLRTTGTDPAFLNTFFSNSRLSFIGSYRQRVQESPQKQARVSGSLEDPAQTTLVFHVDMDSFFASVVLRNFPQYKNKPVAISHFGKTRNDNHGHLQQQPKKDSSSECATCNYEARKYGIKKGMFLGRAKQLCPSLIVLPYDFDGYDDVSQQVAAILQRYASQYDGEVEQVSCDESYVQLHLPAGEGLGEPHRRAGEVGNEIRDEILNTTRCTASIGVGKNKFLAKLGTDRVKPNGCFVVRDHVELLRDLKLRDLHGIGYRTGPKLAEEGLIFVQDVWDLGGKADAELQRVLGPGLGKKIAGFCRGEDDRPVQATERKTIGAECNYGVRFDGPYGVDYMIEGLAKEVQKRMEGAGVSGSRVTLKVKQRKQGAPRPPKFLGHGACHNLSKSVDIGWPTRDWNVISQKGKELLALLKVETDDIRGMGITLSKLDTKDTQSACNGATSSSIMKFFVARKNDSDVIRTNAAGDDAEIDERQEDQNDANFSPDSPKLIQEDDDGPEIEESEVGGDRRLSRSAAVETEDGSQEVADVAEESVEDLDNDEASSSEHSFCDVALPPISQLHFSQVDLLPSPLKNQIHAKIALRKNPDVWQSAKGRKTESNVNGRLRQVDLKRMMRLQEWKNANADMSELKNLPIETQLQLANDDELPLGRRDSTKRKSNSLSSRKSLAIPRVHTSSKEKPLLHCNAGEAALETETSSSGSKQAIANDNPPKDGAADFHEAEGEKTDDTEIGSEEPVVASFFSENVAPAAAFMDENPGAQGEALKALAEFLCVCVREGRLHDAVLLLRNIQNRDDSWGKVAFRHLFMCVDDACEHSEGYRLDSQGLGFA